MMKTKIVADLIYMKRILMSTFLSIFESIYKMCVKCDFQKKRLSVPISDFTKFLNSLIASLFVICFCLTC